MTNFERIYNQNYKTMYRVAQKMVLDGDVVADIVQEVFIAFYKKAKEKHQIQYPKSWLYRATLNKCVDYQKSNQRFAGIEVVANWQEENDEFEKGETKTVIKRALEILKPQERKLAILYSEGFSYNEISEILDMKFTSVGKSLSRTLKKIEKELKKQHYELY